MLLTLPMFVMTILEMMSIALILPVVHIVLADDTSTPTATFLLDILPQGLDSEQTALWVVGVFTVAFVIKNFFLLGLIHLVNSQMYQITALFATRLYEQYLYRPITFHSVRDSSEIVRNLIGGAGQAFEAIRLLLLSFLDLLLMIGVIGVLIYVEPVVTLVATAFLVALGSLFHLVSAPAFYRWGESLMRLEARIISLINQSLFGIRDVKLFRAYNFFSTRYLGLAQPSATFSARSATAMQIPRLFIETVVMIGFMAIVIIFLGMDKSGGDVMSVLGLFGMAAFRLMPSLNRFLANLADLKVRTAYVDELHKDIKDGEVDTDRETVTATNSGLRNEAQIELENIAYSYPDSVHHALHDINLTIKKGESVGLVGASGAGKTTLIDVLLGLLRPRSGQLLVDGESAFAHLADWQRRVGYVPQNFQIMNDTVLRNIAFGVADSEIDEARVRDVIRLVHLDKHIKTLPDGLETILGEFGARFSGGQNQRIAIARALYRDPEVLIFDEATSALDNETEHEITTAIQELAGTKTIVVIAHRLSTVKNCDKLIFMQGGEIRAVGSFDDLMASDSDFKRMAQLGDFNSTLAETAS